VADDGRDTAFSVALSPRRAPISPVTRAVGACCHKIRSSTSPNNLTVTLPPLSLRRPRPGYRSAYPSSPRHPEARPYELRGSHRRSYIALPCSSHVGRMLQARRKDGRLSRPIHLICPRMCMKMNPGAGLRRAKDSAGRGRRTPQGACGGIGAAAWLVKRRSCLSQRAREGQGGRICGAGLGQRGTNVSGAGARQTPPRSLLGALGLGQAVAIYYRYGEIATGPPQGLPAPLLA
jgi:hypothetical protein